MGGYVTHVLVIDNYDSFVYTLGGYLQELGAQTTVVRNDAFGADSSVDVLSQYDAVLLSPGPGKPSEAGVSIPLVGACLSTTTPLLGVCLGLQAIAESLGATVTNAEELMHGKTSLITHDNSELFEGVPQPFSATRYHSLAVVNDTVPDGLVVTARTQGGVIMGMRHKSAPVFGVQFHPESVLTEGGYRLLGNWLAIAGLPSAQEKALTLHPLVQLSQ
jgi:para-aminobenzoate synthetase component II